MTQQLQPRRAIAEDLPEMLSFELPPNLMAAACLILRFEKLADDTFGAFVPEGSLFLEHARMSPNVEFWSVDADGDFFSGNADVVILGPGKKEADRNLVKVHVHVRMFEREPLRLHEGPRFAT